MLLHTEVDTEVTIITFFTDYYSQPNSLLTIVKLPVMEVCFLSIWAKATAKSAPCVTSSKQEEYTVCGDNVTLKIKQILKPHFISSNFIYKQIKKTTYYHDTNVLNFYIDQPKPVM